MFEERYLQVQGIKVHYFDEGKGSVVLLIHGLGGAAINWFRNLGPLSQKHRVIALDLPSFGQSAVPEISTEEIDYGYFTTFLKDFLKELKIKKVVLAGGSMGGGIAIDLTLKFPRLVEKLVIVSGSGLGQEISFYKMVRRPAVVKRVLLQVVSNRTVMRQMAKLAVYDPRSVDEATVAAYVDWLRNPKVKKIIAELGTRAVDFTGQKWLFLDRLAKIPCPTLIVWGRNDRVLPVKQGLKAHELIKGSKLIIFNQCGHIPFLEKPKEFNRVLLEFLADDGKVKKR